MFLQTLNRVLDKNKTDRSNSEIICKHVPVPVCVSLVINEVTGGPVLTVRTVTSCIRPSPVTCQSIAAILNQQMSEVKLDVTPDTTPKLTTWNGNFSKRILCKYRENVDIAHDCAMAALDYETNFEWSYL